MWEVLEEEHNSKIAGHFGKDESNQKVSHNGLQFHGRVIVEHSVISCQVCQRNEVSIHKQF